MGKIIKNYLYNGLYQIFVIIVPLITAPYLARVLGATHLGIYSYVNSASNLIVNIGLLGLYDYGNRQIAYYRDDKEQTSRIFWELVLLRVLLTVAITFFFCIFAINSEYKLYFFLYYPWVLANCMDCSWLFVGMEDMGATCLKNFLAKLVSVVCIFAFVKNINDLWIYILALSISVLLANGIVYSQLHKYIHKAKIEIKNIVVHLKGAFQFFLPQIAMLAYMQVDKVMIATIVGDTSCVAFYDQAEKLIQIPLSLVTVVSTVMMPRIANEFKKDNLLNVKKYVIGSGSFMMLAAFPLAFGLAGIAPQFIPWYLGKEFIPSITAMIALCPIVIANALSGLAGKQYLTATNQMNLLFKSYFITAIINIVLNYIFLQTIGWMGAIIATDVSAICCAFLQLIYMSRSISVVGTIMERSITCIICSFFMFVAVSAIGILMGSRVLTTVTQIISGIVLYFVGLIVTHNPTLAIASDYGKKYLRLRNDKKK